VIRSMTGYGQARWEGDGCAVLVELRSVNNRYFKLSSRVPHEFAAAERGFENCIRESIRRGSVELSVRVDLPGARAARPINKEALASYVRQLREIGDELGVEVAVSAEALASLPGVLDADELADDEAAAIRQGIQAALADALAELDRMRAAEGANLRDDLLRHGEAMETILAGLESRLPESQQSYRERLIERVNRLLADTDMAVGEADLAREIAIYAERSNVSEEITRLRSHIQQLRQAVDQAGPVGRRLEFLAQEMHREVNTMSSKVADAALSLDVVDLHGEVEKIREQVANVE